MLAPLDREPDPSGRAWELAVRVAVLFAIDPAGLGGVRVRAHAGPVHERKKQKEAHIPKRKAQLLH